MNILITGATSGIGEEIANVLSKDNILFLTGRRKSDKTNYFACDLANMSDIKNLFEKANEFFNSKIDVLIKTRALFVPSFDNSESVMNDFVANYMRKKSKNAK